MSDTSLNKIIQYGTNAARIAFTPNPAVGSKVLYMWYTTDTLNFYFWNGAAWVNLTSSGQTFYASLIEGRLTTESGVPVSTTDRTAQGTIYYTPCTPSGVATTVGNIALYNGSALVAVSFTELSLALVVTSGKNYDVFVDYNAGVPQLVLSAAWTNDTTRADALANQSGIVVKSGTTAYRWVGTIRASAANVTEDSLAKRFVWNNYNQVRRAMKGPLETTDARGYTTAAWEQWMNNAANQLAYVCGQAAALIEVEFQTQVYSSTTGTQLAIGIGIDVVNANSAPFFGLQANASNGLIAHAAYKGNPGLGYHFIAALEYGGTNATFYGDNGVPAAFQGAIIGLMWN